MLHRIKELLLGKARDPLDDNTRKHIALTAFLAWVGLGADGLSSSCYGPQVAFLALGKNSELALYLAIAMAATVFIISFAYNQVIELFPNGGGGYKVATQLIGPNAGLFAGSALIVDYILTISISIAGGADAFFSLLPLSARVYKLKVEILLIIILMILNLRGMKESIKVLLPIFIGFVITHSFMIAYGIVRHGEMLPQLVTNAVQDTHQLAALNGGFFVVALFLHAYSLGGGTYTGLEAVSNNVNTLTPPRVKTGKWTMFFMAVSLSITAAGIILLYLLWNVHLVPGQTLNAVAFRALLHDWSLAEPIVIITLIFEFGLLFVGANTGFLGGPAVLSNMALDHWVPNRFRNLSSRLIAQNGVLVFGIASIVILSITHGNVAYLVILYSINVFLAFSISIFGLCRYWWKSRHRESNWFGRLLLSAIGFMVCSIILLIVVISQFTQGGWEALLITATAVVICYGIKSHYLKVQQKLKNADILFANAQAIEPVSTSSLEFDVQAPTAVFFISKSKGLGMHTLLWVRRLFPNYFKNFIFISVGVVDVESYGGEQALALMQKEVESNLAFFKHYAQSKGFPARAYSQYGIDPAQCCFELAMKVSKEVPNAIFFASKLIIENEKSLLKRLHNETALSIQRKLHLSGKQMMIIPMRLN